MFKIWKNWVIFMYHYLDFPHDDTATAAQWTLTLNPMQHICCGKKIAATAAPGACERTFRHDAFLSWTCLSVLIFLRMFYLTNFLALVYWSELIKLSKCVSNEIQINYKFPTVLINVICHIFHWKCPVQDLSSNFYIGYLGKYNLKQ